MLSGGLNLRLASHTCSPTLKMDHIVHDGIFAQLSDLTLLWRNLPEISIQNGAMRITS